MQKTSCTDHLKKEAVLRRVTEEGHILRTIKQRKANRIGHILHRNCLLKHVIEESTEGRTELTRVWGKRCKQLLKDLRKWGYTRSHSVETSLWKRLWTCRKTDYRMKGVAVSQCTAVNVAVGQCTTVNVAVIQCTTVNVAVSQCTAVNVAVS
jgi:hypothetical protein